MNEKKRRLIDDDIVIGLINNFETKQWPNGVMEEGTGLSSKAITRSIHQLNPRFPCLTWLTKLLYLKRFSLN